jgi:uncharacterized protein YkwD
MRIGLWMVAAGVGLVLAPSAETAPEIGPQAAPAPALPTAPIDTQALLEQLNAARSDPRGFGRGLQQYRGWFHGKLLRYPNLAYDIDTEEGVVLVDQTIAWLGRQTPLATVAPSALLARAAAAHLADQARTGAIGHAGSDGSAPGDRVRRLGGGAYVAEVISYGSVDALDAIRQLIVDDGVADRGHRTIVYSPELRFAGAACGPHPVYGTMCVIDLGVTPDGTYPAAGGAARRTAR